MNEVVIIVDPKVQAAYDHFLDMLKNDIAKHLGKDDENKQIPFQIRTSFELGTLEEHALRMIKYHKIIQKMCDNTPRRMGL